MRLTLGTLAVTAAAVFVGLALWPDAPGQPVAPKALAQRGDSDPNALGLPSLDIQNLLEGSQQGVRPLTQQDRATDALPPRLVRGRSADARDPAYASPEDVALYKLKKPLENVSFTEAPLIEVIDHISQSAEVDILIDRQLSEKGAKLDEPVTLEIRHARLPAATVLELALNQAGLGEVAGYTVRDGFVYITSKSQSDQIRVYNVRDLVFGGRASGVGGYGGPAAMPGGEGYGGDAAYGGASMMGGGMAPAMGGLPGAMGYPTAGQPGSSVGGTALTEVIRSTIRPGALGDAVGLSGVAEYNGLLIVKAGEEVHREIEQLLQMMRSAMRGGSGGEAATTINRPVPRR